MYSHVEVCPICQHPHHTEVGRVRDALVAQILRQGGDASLPPIDNTLVRCGGCKLVYLSPRPDAHMLQRIYVSWYGDIYRLSKSERLARSREFKRYHWRLLAPYVAQGAILLDIGTGNGIFLSAIEGEAVSACGIEWDAGAVAQANSILREGTVHQGTLANMPAEWASEERFDVITMFDYLEHTTRPAADLAYAWRLLKPNGVIAVRVPNYRSLQARLMGRAWFGILSVHLSYFDHASLRRALTAQGFQITYVYRGNFQPFHEIIAQPFRYAWYKWFRKQAASSDEIHTQGTPSHTGEGSAFGKATAFIKSVLLLWIDAIGGLLGMGNNLYMIARKS
jgi:2-polyprenyl-3-methyl-5-hydroxy-6-metoxy-1,4-benzoquinol methylase